MEEVDGQSQQCPQHIQSSRQVEAQPEIDSDEDNRRFLSLRNLKPLDLKASWLGGVNQALTNFNTKLEEVKDQNQKVRDGIKLFESYEAKYRQNHKNRLNLIIDEKQMYKDYLRNTRQPIQKINPLLLLNILEYSNTSLMVGLAQMRRVSRIFNYYYSDEEVHKYIGMQDLGHSQLTLKKQEGYAKKWAMFRVAMTVHKNIHYTEQIPHNSLIGDLQQAIEFVNDIYRLVYSTGSLDISYFRMINEFMKRNRVVIGLSSLSLTDLPVIRKIALTAFSNYLALNPSERDKEEITKTKYSKVIQVVEHETHRNCLIINTKLSNLLKQRYGYNFAVFVAPYAKQPQKRYTFYDIILFHRHNENKLIFLQKQEIPQDGVYENEAIDLHIGVDTMSCTVQLIQNHELHSIDMQGNWLPAVYHQNQFTGCYSFKGEQYFLILVQNLDQQSEESM